MRPWQNSNKGRAILVVGPGKSGTSAAARILHTRCGVSMGKRFRNGYYEDLDFKETDDRLFDGKISFGEWLDETEKMIGDRKLLPYAWGYKSPRSTILMGIYLSLLIIPRIVYCIRDPSIIIESMMKDYGWIRNNAENIAKGRMLALNNILRGKDILLIDFTEKLEDEEIERRLKNYLEKK